MMNWVLTYEDELETVYCDLTEEEAFDCFVEFCSKRTDVTEIDKYGLVEVNQWFFTEDGYKTMNKLQQVEFMVEFLEYSEEGAWDLVYGTDTYNVGDDWDEFYDEIPEHEWEHCN